MERRVGQVGHNYASRHTNNFPTNSQLSLQQITWHFLIIIFSCRQNFPEVAPYFRKYHYLMNLKDRRLTDTIGDQEPSEVLLWFIVGAIDVRLALPLIANELYKLHIRDTIVLRNDRAALFISWENPAYTLQEKPQSWISRIRKK